MSGSASYELGPPKEGAGFMFFRSQFLAYPQWAPGNTNLDGKVAVVTGSTSGLGLEASRQLLSLGLSGLIIAVRSLEKGEKVATEFRSEYPAAHIQVWCLDMESYDSVQAFVRRINHDLNRLDIAILNAATQTADFSISPSTGHEMLIQVNYLSTMLLAVLLLPVLKAKSAANTPGRLTIVSSGTARGAAISDYKDGPVLSTFDDRSRQWDPVERYAVSKLLGHLFMIELFQYISDDDVVVNLVDPGLVKGTDLQREAPLLLGIFFSCFKAILGRTVCVGASTYVDAVILKGKESHGCYVADWKISPFAAFAYTPIGTSVRERLWTETMEELEFAGVAAILNNFKTIVKV